MPVTRATCPSCGAALARRDEFCPGCGAAVPPELRAAALEASRARRGRPGTGRWATRDRRGKVASARTALLVIAIFVVLGAGWVAFQVLSAKTDLDRADPRQRFAMDGRMVTVDELRGMLDRALLIALALNLGLAAAFMGLWFWARRNPLGAILVGLGLFLAIHTLAFVLDPTTLLSGIIVKVAVVVFLLIGLRAAVIDRSLRRQAEAG
ncbi:MAG: zinc ribbon domain-containing protein [Planctomycetes bacterium]|nr:zinc ribbon domain-containing protein [Planctomycetota bacterium]